MGPSGSRPEPQPEVAALSAMPERTDKPRMLPREWMAWAVIAVLSLATLGLTWAYLTRQPPPDGRVMRFSILPPEKSSFGQITVSPDGRHLAFTAATGGKVQLWVHAFDSNEAKTLAGTQGAIGPFWSPDSRYIGFFADDRLKKIELTGGPVQTLCGAPFPAGGAWSRDGLILFGRGSGLSQISETGGEIKVVTTPDSLRDELSHLLPTFLPDGRHFLYVISSGQKETRGVYLGSLDGPLKRRLLDDSTDVEYLATVPGDTAGGAGWLLFGSDGALLARPFDTSRLDFTGEPFSLSVRLGRGIDGTYLTFSVSDNGVVVFDPSREQRFRRQYRWVDRHGQTINSLEAPRGFFQHCLSPDEKRFITDRIDPQIGTLDLWLYDISGGNGQRFTLDPASDSSPVWAQNGRRIVWSSNRNAGVHNLYQKAASLAGEETVLTNSEYQQGPTDWSRDGRFIIYSQLDPKTKWDVWVLPMTGSSVTKPFAVAQTADNETGGALSPDGRWLAYTSDVSGQFEIYVQSFLGGSAKQQVSSGGGAGPRWRRDGTELFYYSGDGKLMAAPVRRGENFEVGAAVPLFEFRAGTARTTFASTPYAVTSDGERFLINTVVDLEPNAPLTVVTNLAAGVKK
jgi:eukaryotic-like serine/threonine-protein kinase